MMKRQNVYKFIASLLPLAFVLLLECILRISDYGYDTHLFIVDEENSQYLVMNRDISKKYFTIEENATVGNQEQFYKEKPKGTIRFFVLGASTSLGFPYMHNGSFPRMLKYKLQFEYPEANIEVVNLSLTAVNTYTLYDFSKQVVNYKPDAVIIYTGQNEYYGALGVASSSRLGRHTVAVKSLIALREWKLVQCLSRFPLLKNHTDSVLVDKKRTLMERMAARQLVPYKSDVYKLGINQFVSNLNDILNLFNKHKIPVFISTIVSNIRDQKPLMSDSTSDYNADIEFKFAAEACSRMDYTTAKYHYVQAKEYDKLKFRAPEAFNEQIRNICKKYNQVYMIDAEKVLEEHSPHQILGSEFMLEHVHPNLAGHRLIADAFFKALKTYFFADKKLKKGFTVNLENYPVTAFDTIYGELSISQLKTQWPFNEVHSEFINYSDTFACQLAASFLYGKMNWGEAMMQLNNHYMLEGNMTEALKIVEGMSLELPYDSRFSGQAGNLCMQLKQYEKALYYLQKTFLMSPNNNILSNMVEAYLRMDCPENAISCMDKLRQQYPAKYNMQALYTMAKELLRLKLVLYDNDNISNESVMAQISSIYEQMGMYDVALKYKPHGE